MALGFDFFGGRGGPSFISGPQFEQDPKTLKLVSHTFGGTGVETIYTVPAGKTLYVTKITLVNIDAATARLFTVLFDGIQIYRKVLPQQSTTEVDFPSPVALTAGLAITGQSADAGSITNVIGWEV